MNASAATNASLSAAVRFLGITELLEKVLIELAYQEFVEIPGASKCRFDPDSTDSYDPFHDQLAPIKQLFVLQRVSRSFRYTIRGSQRLRQLMLFEALASIHKFDDGSGMAHPVNYHPNRFVSLAWLYNTYAPGRVEEDGTVRKPEVLGRLSHFGSYYSHNPGSGWLSRPEEIMPVLFESVIREASWRQMRINRFSGDKPLEISIMDGDPTAATSRIMLSNDATLGDFADQYLALRKQQCRSRGSN